MRKFCKTALSTSVPIIVFGHKYSFSTSRAITFTSCGFVFLHFIKFVNCHFSLLHFLFISHCHLLPPLDRDFVSAAVACLAFNLVAFSSSKNFFLSSFDIFLNIL